MIYGRSEFCRRYCFTAGIGVKTSFCKMSKPNEVSVAATDRGLLVDVLLQSLNGTPADFNLAVTMQVLHVNNYLYT